VTLSSSVKTVTVSTNEELTLDYYSLFTNHAMIGGTRSHSCSP
jgi:hypothetical protein